MQPFTFDQAVIAGLLFLLGILIGMFFLAGGKWKQRYRTEAAERQALLCENERLRREADAYRVAAERPAHGGVTHDRDRDGTPDRIDPRPSDPRV